MARPIFLYGTLLDPRTLARRGGDARLPRATRPALLPGHARVRLRGTPYPTLRPDPDAATPGLLLRPHPAALARLRAYEGLLYRLRPVRALTPRGPVLARAWITHPRLAEARDWP